MQAFPMPQRLNGETLAAELGAAGVTLNGNIEAVGDELRLPVTGGDRATVERVLTAHGGAPSPRVAHETSVRRAASDAIRSLRQVCDAGSLTNAQAQAAIKLLAANQIRIIRLLLADLDELN